MTHRVAENSLPLRDTFAVLFFVSVGMLFDWHVLLEEPATVLVFCLIIVVGKGLAALGIARLLGAPRSDSLYAAAALAQIGEFSFVLAGLGLTLDLMSQRTHDLILAAALISILVNPLLFRLVQRRIGAPAEGTSAS
jgi:CPA2 family monovalent cation:H+ antiporter-2